MTTDPQYLAPCPFCGGSAELIEVGPAYGLCHAEIRCTECEARTAPHVSRTMPDPTGAWNTRSPGAAGAGWQIPEGYALVPVEPTEEMIEELLDDYATEQVIRKPIDVVERLKERDADWRKSGDGWIATAEEMDPGVVTEMHERVLRSTPSGAAKARIGVLEAEVARLRHDGDNPTRWMPIPEEAPPAKEGSE